MLSEPSAFSVDIINNSFNCVNNELINKYCENLSTTLSCKTALLNYFLPKMSL